MSGWIVTYSEVSNGPLYKYGPVRCSDPAAAVDALDAAYAQAGFTAPRHIYQIKEVSA